MHRQHPDRKNDARDGVENEEHTEHAPDAVDDKE
jgi:hypothetical protein